MTEADFAPETLELARTTMKGALRDLVLDHMRDAKQGLPWNMRPEPEQKTIIEFIEMSISAAISEAVQIIARDGKRAIVGQVDQVLVKDGLKVVMKTQLTETNLMILGGSVGKTVLVTSADADDYMGAQQRHPEPLQQDLLDEGPVFDETPGGGKR